MYENNLSSFLHKTAEWLYFVSAIVGKNCGFAEMTICSWGMNFDSGTEVRTNTLTNSDENLASFYNILDQLHILVHFVYN